MPKTFKPLLRLAPLLATLLLTLPGAHARDTLDADWGWSAVSEQQARTAQVRERAQDAVPSWQSRASGGEAQISLHALFSAQAGSWPFEPFVNNGLFRAIAGYQSSHPRVLSIGKGSITLERLTQRVNNPEVLKRFRDGYLLSYPLMIEADGTLEITDSHLYLFTPSGTALINQGTLRVRGSTVESRNEDHATTTDRPYRPFIMAWAGSTTEIQDSTLRRLGYNTHLSRGLSSARSNGQPMQQAPARVLLRNSKVDELSSIELQHALVRIEHSQLDNMQQYGIDLSGSRFLLDGNQIRAVRNQSGIRIRGLSQGLVENNLILKTGKAGVEISEQSGDLVVSGNQIGASDTHGVLIRNVAGGALLVDANLIANSGASGVLAENLQQGYIVGNRIHSSRNYAISAANPVEQPGELVIVGNNLGNVGQSMIRTLGIQALTLGDNEYQLGPLLQSVLAGDTLPLQSLLLDATHKRGCIIQVRPATASQATFPANSACPLKRAGSEPDLSAADAAQGLRQAL